MHTHSCVCALHVYGENAQVHRHRQSHGHVMKSVLQLQRALNGIFESIVSIYGDTCYFTKTGSRLPQNQSTPPLLSTLPTPEVKFNARPVPFQYTDQVMQDSRYHICDSSTDSYTLQITDDTRNPSGTTTKFEIVSDHQRQKSALYNDVSLQTSSVGFERLE